MAEKVIVMVNQKRQETQIKPLEDLVFEDGQTLKDLKKIVSDQADEINRLNQIIKSQSDQIKAMSDAIVLIRKESKAHIVNIENVIKNGGRL